MRIFFDVDLTLLSEDGVLRSGVQEVLARLREGGHEVYLWSGNGIRWGFVDRYGLRDLVAGCLYKPLYEVRAALARQGIEQPDFCVDDYPECVQEFGGVQVTPYGMEDPEDRELERVYNAIRAAEGKQSAGDDLKVPLRGVGEELPVVGDQAVAELPGSGGEDAVHGIMGWGSR